MGESEEGIPTGLSLTLSIPLFLMSLLCLYISVSLYLTISPYLCVSPGVNISLILPSVYSLYLNSLLNNTHTYIYCNTHTPLKIQRHKYQQQISFLAYTLKHGLEMQILPEPTEPRKTGFYTFQIRSAEYFCTCSTNSFVPGSNNSPVSNQQECKGHGPEDGHSISSQP